MATVIRCPACDRRLRVPDDLLGKSVKCPQCQATFTATEAGEAPGPAAASEEAPSEPPSPPRAHPRRRAERPEESYQEEPSPAGRRRRPRPEEEDEDEDDYEERPRRRRRRDLGYSDAEVRNVVAAPAVCLMVIGILAIVIPSLNLVLSLVLDISLLGRGPRQGGPVPADLMGSMIGQVLGTLIALSWGGLVTFGAVKMKNLQSYGLAMAACIAAIVPCCCGLGIPFGIWGLVVLNRPEVKDAFA